MGTTSGGLVKSAMTNPMTPGVPTPTSVVDATSGDTKKDRKEARKKKQAMLLTGEPSSVSGTLTNPTSIKGILGG